MGVDTIKEIIMKTDYKQGDRIVFKDEHYSGTGVIVGRMAKPLWYYPYTIWIVKLDKRIEGYPFDCASFIDKALSPEGRQEGSMFEDPEDWLNIKER